MRKPDDREMLNTNTSRRHFMMGGSAVAGGVLLPWLPMTAFCQASENGHSLLVDTETFKDLGGWVLDTQSFDQIGSAYLLAHGAGVPVEDASTTIEIPCSAKYRVWVRTRDWVHPHGPGQFRLKIAEHMLATNFGVGKGDWHWQDGGLLQLNAGKVKLTLNDLTGFEGRCEAIILSSDPEFTPPEAGKDLRDFRRKALGLSIKTAIKKQYDLVVAGGGIAGICCAIAAARSGCKVALVHNRPVLGGNSSSEIGIPISGATNHPLYPKIGNIVQLIKTDKRGKQGLVEAEKNIDLFLLTQVTEIQIKDQIIESIMAVEQRTGTELLLEAPLFADCTGDGNLGVMARAKFRMGREAQSEFGESSAPPKADKQVLGASLPWSSKVTSDSSPFPACPWAVQFNEESCQNATGSIWNWEAGFFENNAAETESIRDSWFRVIYGNWDFQKNRHHNRKKYENLKLDWVTYNLGKRESRRLEGDLIFTQKDIESGEVYPDAAVGCVWGVDIHVPSPKNAEQFPEWPFRSVAHHNLKQQHPVRYLPYRCFYSNNIRNLFMAGRNVSQSHLSLAMFRVQCTTGMMGEVVGIAAAICRAQGTLPRDVYTGSLATLQEKLKAGLDCNVKCDKLHYA
ncbi:MAG: FAD-dependent oxidoreductase [Kiritimatiellia bacterium]